LKDDLYLDRRSYVRMLVYSLYK